MHKAQISVFPVVFERSTIIMSHPHHVQVEAVPSPRSKAMACLSNPFVSMSHHNCARQHKFQNVEDDLERTLMRGFSARADGTKHCPTGISLPTREDTDGGLLWPSTPSALSSSHKLTFRTKLLGSAISSSSRYFAIAPICLCSNGRYLLNQYASCKSHTLAVMYMYIHTNTHIYVYIATPLVYAAQRFDTFQSE